MTPRYVPPNLRLEPGEAAARKRRDIERRGGSAALAAAHDRYGQLHSEPRENRTRSSLTEFRTREGIKAHSALPRTRTRRGGSTPSPSARARRTRSTARSAEPCRGRPARRVTT